MTDADIPDTLPPKLAAQVAVLYLAAAKLDANPDQAERLSTISGPPGEWTTGDARRVVGAVKGHMGSAWKLSPQWAFRLAELVHDGLQEGQ